MSRKTEIESFEAFFHEQYAPLSRYVLRLAGSRDDALEIVQESFLRIWELSRGGRESRQQAGLLFRLAHNLVIDLLRRRNVREKHAREVSGRVLTMPPNPEQMALGGERQRLANAALRELEPKQREVLRLRAAGFSYGEVSTILGMNAESIGPTLMRALRRFRTVYEERTGSIRERERDETAG